MNATKWYQDLTPAQQKRVEKACQQVYDHFGSYPKIAAALTEETGFSISHETVRGYLQQHKVPVHIAASLSDMTGVPLFEFVPWLPYYCGGVQE